MIENALENFREEADDIARHVVDDDGRNPRRLGNLDEARSATRPLAAIGRSGSQAGGVVTETIDELADKVATPEPGTFEPEEIEPLPVISPAGGAGGCDHAHM